MLGVNSCYPFAIFAQLLRDTGGAMLVCPRYAAKRRRRGVLARAANAMRKDRCAGALRLPLARAGSYGTVPPPSPALSDASHRARAPRMEPGHHALTLSLGERRAGVVRTRARRAPRAAVVLLLATFLLMPKSGSLSTSTTISRMAASFWRVLRSSASSGTTASASGRR